MTHAITMHVGRVAHKGQPYDRPLWAVSALYQPNRNSQFRP
jgi:hypothetical protein